MALALLGAVVGVAAMGIASGTPSTIGPGTVEISAAVSTAGETRLRVPPLGTVTSSTHRSPLRLEVRLDEIDLSAANLLLVDGNPAARLVSAIEDDLTAAARRFAVRSIGVAALAGLVAALVLPGRRLSDLPAAAGGGALCVSVLLLLTWNSFRIDAFAGASFSGALEYAPQVVDAVSRHVDDLDAIEGRVEVLSRQLADLYTVSASGAVPGIGGETVILHVSDIHSNPLALEVVAELARSFDVDAVLDTGDLTSFGLVVEARMSQLVERVPARYIFVPGNHDSPLNRQLLAEARNLELLDGDVAVVGDVRILGVADPTYTADGRIGTADANETKRLSARSVAAQVRRYGPDLLAVHDLRQAERAVGDVPVVVAGHVHETSREIEDGTMLLTVGSTGATGLGSFTVDTGMPYVAQLLRFQEGDLVAIDEIELQSLGGDFSLRRTIVAEEEEEEEEATDALLEFSGARRDLG